MELEAPSSANESFTGGVTMQTSIVALECRNVAFILATRTSKLLDCGEYMITEERHQLKVLGFGCAQIGCSLLLR